MAITSDAMNNQINPNAGPMRVDNEIVFLQEYDKMTSSIPFQTDSYKPSMDPQYPAEVETVHSYVESRGGIHDHVVMAGSQPYIDALAEGTNLREINLAREYWAAHGVPFPYDMWKTVVNDFGGRIPLRIRAVPEGMVLPNRNVLATVENVGGRATRAMTTWVETKYLSHIWYMSTVATNSWFIKELIGAYYEVSVDAGAEDPSLMFRLHDFGYRGVAPGAGPAGGCAHLFNFMGTDTFGAIPYAVRHYEADPALTAYSIPAMEHSTVTSWGREREGAAFDNMTDTYAVNSSSLYAMVIDSYNPPDAVNYITNPNGHIVQKLKATGATCVLRPDSGDPVSVLPQLIKIVAQNVGFTTNKKGYKILNHFRFIWGDGIDALAIESILRTMVGVMGFSAENFAFGMGGRLLQVVNRDDLEFAMKCSAVRLTDGSWRNVYKQPAGVISKNSKQGLVETFVAGNGWHDEPGKLYVRDIRDQESIKKMDLQSLLVDVFDTGTVKARWDLERVRKNTQIVYDNAEKGHSAGVYASLI